MKYHLDYEQIVPTIKSYVNMDSVVSFYTGLTPHKGRIPCPIHNGQDNNFAFSHERFYCYVCGAKGDCISFVEQLFGLDFKEACRKIITDFGVPIPLDRPMNAKEKQKVADTFLKFQALQKQKAEEEQKYWAKFDELWGDYVRYDKAIREKSPKTPDDEPCPEWVEAVSNIERIKYRIQSEL